MKHLYFPIKTISPLSIRSDHAQDGAATTQAIPGSTVLGSLASAYRLLRPDNDQEFDQLFLNESISLPYLYPATFKGSTFQQKNLPVVPLPKTAQTCKRFPGFWHLPDEEDDEERHGIRDSLFDWAIFSLLHAEDHDISTQLAMLTDHKECHCLQAMDHAPGYYRQLRSGEKLQPKPETHLQTRTGINRTWGVVEERILYNREVFSEGMCFWGEIILPDELYELFIDFLEEALKEEVLSMGTGRTRGLGRFEIANKKLRINENVYAGTRRTQSPGRTDIATTPLLLEVKREERATFEKRLHDFNNDLQKQAKSAGVKELDDFYLAITLRSATILRDRFLRYATNIDGAAIARELQEPENTFRNIYQATEIQRVTGWNELWGTPRPNDYALTMGSTFLFSCKRVPDSELLQKLYDLEEAGIGQRRAEGFGRICISDPFHLEGKQV